MAEELLHKLEVRLFGTGKRHGETFRLVAVGALLALWLGTFAFAVFPQLHSWLHKDADHSEHSCVLTQISHGSLLAATGALTVPMPAIFSSEELPVCDSGFQPSFSYLVSDGRAPPVLVSSRAVVG